MSLAGLNSMLQIMLALIHRFPELFIKQSLQIIINSDSGTPRSCTYDVFQVPANEQINNSTDVNN
jgi:hypothetical protein